MQMKFKDYKKKNTIVIIPTYNEAKNISFLIKAIFFHYPEFFILIVDDDSPDGTSRQVRKLQNEYPNLYLITRERRLGLGSAYIEGFKYALEKEYEVIIQMDADFSHSPEYISSMVSLSSDYDLIIASRYIKGGGTSNWPLLRRALSKTANIFSKALLRLPVNDLTSGFKVIKRTVLEEINFNTITSKGYSFQIEMIYRVCSAGFRVIEYPIVFNDRNNEKSKMSFGIIIEAFFKVVFLCIKRNLKFVKRKKQ